MSSSAALSESMQRITTSKLNVLQKQRDTYEIRKQATLDAVRGQSNLPEQLLTLIDALVIHDVPPLVPNLSPDNVRRFLNQRRNDPSVSTAMLEGWKLDLERCLDIHSHKYEFASLFGQLVTEWLEKPSNAPALQRQPSSDSADTLSQDAFEPLGRQEMYDQWREWETLVFNPAQKSDPQNIKAYLSSLFESTAKAKKLTKTPLETLRARLKAFDLSHFDKDSLKRSIAGLLKTDLLAPSKRAALMDIKGNDLVLGEMVDVLNIQIDDLDQWSWEDEPVSVDLRRQLNGKYRVYMDEELLQALLIHFIGVRWAVHLKDAFTTFFHSGAWKLSSHRAPDRKARARRDFFLGKDYSPPDTVRNERRKDYEEDFFMTQLPSTIEEGSREYNGALTDVESEIPDYEKGLASKKDPMEIKQSLLHLVTTESLINTSLYGTFTVLQSDFRWFGPSLPHTTIFAVLEYLGIKDRWLKFFRKFLETPLRFVQDGPDAPTNVRRCGVPIEHALSDALGESVLFCLDFAVNQATHTNLYRFHDDLWFWGQEDVCVKAWATIGEFAKTMGLSVNEEKTGSVQVTQQPNASKPSKSLPQGKVHWGFLQLDTTGSWVINDAEVTHHISELRRQLQACNSVLATVQAWNVYASRFLANNFGQPQRCLGQRHIDMVIATFSDIQRRLFSDTFGAGSLLEYLKRIIEERFHVTGLPDGFFYFPLGLGGLDVRNPLIPLLLVREVQDTAAQRERMIGEAEKQKDPKEWIQEAFEREEEEYERCKKRYDDGEAGLKDHDNKLKKLDDDEEEQPFMSFEEFTRYREETSTFLLHAYLRLREEPSQKDVTLTTDVQAALKQLPRQAKEGIHGNEAAMGGYWKWVAQLYAGDVLARFGGLSMGEKKLLPLGLVTMLRGEKVRWEG
ncbi:MAG: hypothetical protein LQ341_006325 [Variospora aurantia]|nr:MAG: hypothetical protein LQ341_006325 [Variospora aurantia]